MLEGVLMKKNEYHRSTQRVVEILAAVKKEENYGLSLSDLARSLDAPKSSLFPIVQTLYQLGFLSLNKETAKYTIGYKAYEIGCGYLESGRLKSDLSDILSGMVAECLETCYLAELVSGDVLYLMRIDSPETIRMVATPGRRLPAYATGIGKALISGKTKAELQEIYRDGLEPLTENTIVDMDVLYQQILEIRKTGIAYEVEESTPHVRCLAVPIHKDGEIIAAMSVAVPVFRYTKEKELLIGKLLKENQKKIEKIVNTLGWNDVGSNV